MITALLPGDDPTFKEFIKYRRILKSTNESLFRSSYKTALAKLQTVIMKKHSELKRKADKKNATLIKIAEKLLTHWNIYHF